MKKKLLQSIILCALWAAAFQSADAQTTAFTYQGSLNFNGAPANGNYDFEFAMFNPGNVQIGSTVTLTNIPVANGVFAVTLDFGDQFQGADRLLEIRVRPAGGGAFTVLTPRQPMTSAPYAIKSLNASNAINANTANTATNALQLGGFAAAEYIRQGAAVITAGTQFNIGGSRVLSISGTGNIFTGASAGASNIGAFNSFFGSGAGVNNTTGTRNAFFGNGSGFNLTNNSDLSLFGASTHAVNGVNNATAIGSRAFVSQSNSIVLGSINGVNFATEDTNVGIGTTAPTTRLDVKGAASQIRFGDTVTDDGGYLTSTVSSQAVLSGGAKWNGSNFVARSASSSAINMFSGAIRFFNDTGLTVGATFSPTEVMRISANGNLGIGTTSPAERLDVNGIIRVSTLGAAGSTNLCRNASNQISTCSSSARYKSNINPFGSGLSLIRKLRPVSFDWEAGGPRDLGLVAEEVAAVEPLLVTKNEKGEVEGVKYDRVGVVLVNAVQEQQTQIEAQERRNEGQQKQINEQKELIRKQQAEIEALKQFICSQNLTAEICKKQN